MVYYATDIGLVRPSVRPSVRPVYKTPKSKTKSRRKSKIAVNTPKGRTSRYVNFQFKTSKMTVRIGVMFDLRGCTMSAFWPAYVSSLLTSFCYIQAVA